MKKLEDFQNKLELNLSSIFGGNWVNSGSSTSTDSNGCTVTKSEQFNDSNGDGKYQGGESILTCASVDCDN